MVSGTIPSVPPAWSFVRTSVWNSPFLPAAEVSGSLLLKSDPKWLFASGWTYDYPVRSYLSIPFCFVCGLVADIVLAAPSLSCSLLPVFSPVFSNLSCSPPTALLVFAAPLSPVCRRLISTFVQRIPVNFPWLSLSSDTYCPCWKNWALIPLLWGDRYFSTISAASLGRVPPCVQLSSIIFWALQPNGGTSHPHSSHLHWQTCSVR